MKFRMHICFDVPDHISNTLPEAPDLQAELQALIGAAVTGAIAHWASAQSEQNIHGQVIHLNEVEPGVFSDARAPIPRSSKDLH